MFYSETKTKLNLNSECAIKKCATFFATSYLIFLCEKMLHHEISNLSENKKDYVNHEKRKQML